MKHWQIVIVLAVLSFGSALLIEAPLGSREISQYNTPAPTPTPADGIARMVFVGDIMLSRSVGDVMTARQDWLWPFRAIASVTAGADLAFANLESVISDQGMVRGCGFCFRADPRAVSGLAFGGFDVVSVANNHAWDYGPEAFGDSVRRLSEAGIAAVGAGREPVVRDVRGTRIAFLAYTDLLPQSVCSSGVNCYDAARMAEDIVGAQRVADVVVVSFHAGEEYASASAQQRLVYRSAIDAGADLVVGHHPHVVQELEQYRDGWIAYSLGNFIFDQTFSTETMMGMLLDVSLDRGRITTVVPRTVRISSQYQPSLLP